jgi:methionyl-tRNA formyltransferase
LRTVYLGTSEFAAGVLEQLAASVHRPALVLTRPDRPRGRGRQLSSPPVATKARELEIALEQPASVNDEVVLQRVAQEAPEALVVCAFGALIKEPLLSAYEIFNVHPSLLPRWRGAAPIERAIMAGDNQTGVAIMRLTAGLDSGPVCLTASEPIGAQDTFGSLAPRLRDLGAQLLVRALSSTPSFIEQDGRGVTYAEKIGPAERLLHPARPAVELERVVRALHPHIGARVALADETLLGVHRARLVSEDASAPASVAPRLGVTEHEGRLLLVCRTGALELLEVQPPGGRAMEAGDYLRGHGAPRP